MKPRPRIPTDGDYERVAAAMDQPITLRTALAISLQSSRTLDAVEVAFIADLLAATPTPAQP